MFEQVMSEESTNGHLDVEQVHPGAYLDVSQWLRYIILYKINRCLIGYRIEE